MMPNEKDERLVQLCAQTVEAYRLFEEYQDDIDCAPESFPGSGVEITLGGAAFGRDESWRRYVKGVRELRDHLETISTIEQD
jgi:hypothetical protein